MNKKEKEEFFLVAMGFYVGAALAFATFKMLEVIMEIS